MKSSTLPWAIAAILLLALMPLVGGSFAIDLVTKTMIHAMLALSLWLLVGRTGLVCFGHAALFGIGAYAAVLLAPQAEPASAWWLIPAAVLASALWALIMGALSLRTKGVYFIMVTLAFAQMAYYVVHDTPLGGGTDGIYLNLRPTLAVGGLTLVNLDSALSFYFLVLALLTAAWFVYGWLLDARFGRVLDGIRVNEQRVRAAGFSTYPYKLAAFVLSGGLAGLAGALLAIKDGYVNPELLSWHLSGALLVMVILGGLSHPGGALLGAFAYTLLQEFFQHEAWLGGWASHWQLGFGATIILAVALLPRGLIGLPALWRPAHSEAAEDDAPPTRPEIPARSSPAAPRPPTGQGTILLEGRHLTRRWGGLVAVDDVSIALRQGEVHAVIGTNGAGKSTLVNLLAGEFAPSSGEIQLLGHTVTHWSQPRRARAGLGRSYQRNTIFPSFTVAENCRLAAQAAHPLPWTLWPAAHHCPVSVPAGREAAQQAGLTELAGQQAGNLSHGRKRQLEIAMCLATKPRVLLLDEPLAGMGAEETTGMLELIHRLRPGHAILLVEHDMDAVFRVADVITVMVNGRVICSGTPDQVRADPAVQLAYLGGEHA